MKAKSTLRHDEEAKIDVKCPTCDEIRQMTIYWTGGQVMPRIRCNRCKTNAERKYAGMISVRLESV